MLKKRYVQNLFSVEPNRASITNPFRLATSYFPPLFHWIPEQGQKNVQYYSAILQHENSITIKPIKDKTNGEKIIYHNVYLNHIISEEKWGPNPTTTRTLPNFPIRYSYHDYITAWFRFMLHQNETSVVVFSVSPSVSTRNFGTPLLCSLLTVVGATLVVK